MKSEYVRFLAKELGVGKSDVSYLFETEPGVLIGRLGDIIGEESDKIDVNHDHDDTRVTMAEDIIAYVFIDDVKKNPNKYASYIKAYS